MVNITGIGWINEYEYGCVLNNLKIAYQSRAHLKKEIFPGIAAKKVAGYKAIQLFRRPLEDEVEFITIMWFDSCSPLFWHSSQIL